jgi:hypothetical protein
MIKKMECQLCIYFDGLGRECRRHAPSHGGKFPNVGAFDWCGDFEQKQED